MLKPPPAVELCPDHTNTCSIDYAHPRTEPSVGPPPRTQASVGHRKPKRRQATENRASAAHRANAQDPGGSHTARATDELRFRGNVEDEYAFVTDGVEHGAGGRLLDGWPVKARGVLYVDGGPAAGPIADVGRDALGPGRGDELGDEAVTFSLTVQRGGQHDLAGADTPVCGSQGCLHVW